LKVKPTIVGVTKSSVLSQNELKEAEGSTSFNGRTTPLYRSVNPLRANKCRERLSLLFKKGLKEPLAYIKAITMWHNVLRAVFPGLLSDLCGSPYLTRGGCLVDTPVHLKLFLSKLPAFLNENGCKTASCPVKRVQVKLTKSYFSGNLQ
ncbi:hypothetical protein pdam_00024329, partial [Pocillopora damicornis]